MIESILATLGVSIAKSVLSIGAERKKTKADRAALKKRTLESSLDTTFAKGGFQGATYRAAAPVTSASTARSGLMAGPSASQGLPTSKYGGFSGTRSYGIS